MRFDNPKFATADRSSDKRARFVVVIEFDVGTLYFTSHTGISGVPGTVFEGVLQNISAQSQRIVPDEGRSEIGSMSFSVVDRSSAVTTEFRSKLNSSKGLRGKTVRLYRGYEGFAWSEFSLFQTQMIHEVEYDLGAYRIECSDITREQRKEIFEPKTTNLRLACTDSDTTISVYDTAAFVAVEHGTSWSDGPSGTYGYIKIQDEVIRWSGKTADTFTGCERGALNTRAKAHAVDATASSDQRTKVEEVIYLELPAAKLAYAILTGVLYGQTGTLPAHWCLGISTTMVKLSDFTGIGTDLWNVSDDTSGLILRFAQEKAQDGKSLLEKQIYSVMGCFSPVYADGRLGLRRMAALTSDAAAVLTLTEDHIVSHSGLTHDMPGLINDFQIDWSYDGKEPRRRSRFVDQNSVIVHGRAPLKKLDWRGVYGSRSTDVTIWQRLFALRDRYSAPPERIQVRLLASLSSIEVGDVAKLNVSNLRDFAGSGAKISRAFEAQRISLNHSTGDLDVEFFGSTARPTTTPPADITSFPLPDAFYSSAGTLLSAVSGVSMTGNSLTTAPGTPINGGTDMTAPAAIIYWLGDLTIPNGVTLRIAGNVWLRVMGYLTINGVIDGDEGGLAGVADDGAVSPYLLGNPGFIGNSRGRDGLRVTEMGGNPQLESQPVPTTQGRFDAFPFLSLQVSGNNLLGVPTDLRGTGGGPGGKVVFQSSLRANGGPGGAGGAGLCITARGVTFGASGQITLRGADTSSPSPHLEQGKNFYPGTGGAGGPGALLILIDGGPSIAVPDLTGKFYGVTGSVAVPFYSAEFPVFFMPSRAHQRRNRSEQPYAGYEGPEIISGLDLSNAAHRIQYIPPTVLPSDDVDYTPAPPDFISAAPGPGYNLITIVPAIEPNSVVELYTSVDSLLANAVPLADVSGTQFYHQLLNQETRWYWARTKVTIDGNLDVYSDWCVSVPSSTAGVAIAQDLPEEQDFLETFDGQNVLTRYTSESGSGVVTYPQNGSFGGRALRVAGGSRKFVYNDNIPLDPAGVYRMSVRVRQVAAPTNANNDGIWIGFRAIAADGTTTVLASGTDHYPAAANYDMGLSVLGSWVVLTGYFGGASAAVLSPAPDQDTPSAVASGASYFRPIIWANYLDGDGTQEFDYVRVEKLVAGRWKDIDGDGKPSDYADNTAANAPAISGVYYDAFEHQNWPLYYSNRSNSGTVLVSYPQEGANGGRVIQATEQFHIAWKENIPFDPNAWYRVTARVRRTAASSNSNEFIWFGVEGVAADGVTLINASGANSFAGQHWVAAAGQDLSLVALNTWTTVTGYFKGNGTPSVPANSVNSPSPLYTGVAYFRPAMILNYNGGDGTQQCDFFRVERLTQAPTALIEPNAATETYSATDTGAYAYATSGGNPTRQEYLCGVSFTPTIDCTVKVTCTFEGKTDTAGAGSFQALLRTGGVNVATGVENRPFTSLTPAASQILASVTAGVTYTAYLSLKITTQPVQVDVARMSTVVELIKR